MADEKKKLVSTAAQLDKVSQDYANSELEAARVLVNTEGFSDPTLNDDQAVAQKVDEGAVKIELLEEQVLLKTSGVISDPTFTDNGDGTATIGGCTVNLYATNNFTGQLTQYDVLGDTFVFTDGEEGYVCVNYNSGTPLMYIETVKTNINNSSIILLFVCWRQGDVVHSVGTDSYGLGLAERMASRARNTNPYMLTVDGGMMISEVSIPTHRTVLVTSATVYAGVVPVNVLAYNSSTDLLTKVVNTDGDFTYDSTSHVYDATNYNPTTGEVPLPANKIKVIWFYRSIGDIKEVFYMNGTGYYNSTSDALLEVQPSKPNLLRDHCVLIGRILFKQGGTSGLQVVQGLEDGIQNIIPIDAITGKGTPNKLIKYIEENVVGDSSIDDDGTRVSIPLPMKVGDGGVSNYSEFESNGFQKFNGTSAYWRDIDFPIIIRTTGAGIPTMTTFNGNLTMPQWAVNDFNVCESQEFVHAWAEGSTCYWHLHLNTNGSDGTDRYVRFELEYGYVDGNSVWTFPSVVTTSDLLIPANTPSKKQIIMSLANFTPTGSKVGGHVVARLKRVASVGAAPTNNPWIPMLQLHVKCDTNGSRNMTTK